MINRKHWKFAGLILAGALIYGGITLGVLFTLFVSEYSIPLQLTFFFLHCWFSWQFVYRSDRSGLRRGLLLVVAFLVFFGVPLFSPGKVCDQESGVWGGNGKDARCSCIGIKSSAGFSLQTYCSGVRTACYAKRPFYYEYTTHEERYKNALDEYGSNFTGVIKLSSHTEGQSERYLVGLQCDYFDEYIIVSH